MRLYKDPRLIYTHSVDARMFRTLARLFQSETTYISFGATVIACDARNVCSLYDPLDHAAFPAADAPAPVATA